MLRELEESDLRPEFWRLLLYHLTKLPWGEYITRKQKSNPPGLLFCFFMHGALHAPLAKFIELDLALNFLLVLLAPIIRALALGAIEFYKTVLGHGQLISW